MSVIKVDYGEVGGSAISKESGMLTVGTPIRIKTKNCAFLLFNKYDAPDAWSNSSAATMSWCGVYDGAFVEYHGQNTITMTYDSTTNIMSVTSTDARWTSYLIFGDYEVLT